MTDGEQLDDGVGRPRGTLGDYLRIARLDHSAKHVFILPGIVLAYLLRGVHAPSLPLNIVLGFGAAFAIASANYVINEFLDRDFDRHHPTKAARAAVQRRLDGRIILAEVAVLVVVGLSLARLAGDTMLLAAAVFALQGVVYNLPPVRTKDRTYVDVVSEAINNPLRLMIGWAMVDPTTFPPSSVILAYWLGGAFLMAAKRLSEYRELAATAGRDVLARYRASFAGYSEESLTVSCFVYALLSMFFVAVFLIKYRIEYLLLMPLLIAMFGQYMALAMRPGSSAQRPEKLYAEHRLVALVVALVAAFVATTLIDIPQLSIFTNQQFIGLP